jgi:elongator complex protein 4
LGGGLPLGHVAVVLAPDIHSSWGELILRYFVAQGLSNEHEILVVDDKPSRLVEGCMWHAGSTVLNASQNVEGKDLEDSKQHEEGEVKIAWRYEQMKQFKTTVDDQDLKNG